MSVPWDPTERGRPQPSPPPPLAAARPSGTSDVQAEEAASPIGKVFGGYRILSVIQRGGMGEIFLGQTIEGPMAGRQVVLKRLLADYAQDERYRGMIGAEARVTMCMDHPNIVKVFEAPIIDGKQWLAMEFVHGRNVSQILKRCRKSQQRLPPQVALQIMLHVLEGLSYAHSMVLEDGTSLDLVHRDVTPGNILVSFDGAVKMTDFGIAKSRMSVVSTTVGVVKGTTRYLSPEQIRGQDLDGRSDIFSAGTVLTEMLTGKPLFDRGAVPPTLFAIIKGERKPVADLLPFPAPKLAAAIERALEISPRNRFRDAAEFADALREAQRELGRPLPADGVGRFVQELFDTRPRKITQSSPNLPRASLDLTYLFEVNDTVTRDITQEPPPVANAELEAELEQLLAGVTPLAPEEFEDASPVTHTQPQPPPVPPASARMALPSFPGTASGRIDLDALAKEVTASLEEPPPRFPPPRRTTGVSQVEQIGDDEVVSIVDEEPEEIATDAVDNREAILQALDQVVGLVEASNPTPAPQLELVEQSSTKRRVLFLAGILCGALLVWGATVLVARMLPDDAPATPAPVAVEEEPETAEPAPAEVEAPAPELASAPAPVVEVGRIDLLRPRGARVYVDGVLVPKRVPVLGLELEPGRHRVLVRKRRYRRRITVDVEAGQHLDVTRKRFREIRDAGS